MKRERKKKKDCKSSVKNRKIEKKRKEDGKKAYLGHSYKDEKEKEEEKKIARVQ